GAADHIRVREEEIDAVVGNDRQPKLIDLEQWKRLRCGHPSQGTSTREIVWSGSRKAGADGADGALAWDGRAQLGSTGAGGSDQVLSNVSMVRAAPPRNARRRWISTIGILACSELQGSTRSVPARSSSSTLLAGSSARPKPASTIRFCAVRLSIGMTSAVP